MTQDPRLSPNQVQAVLAETLRHLEALDTLPLDRLLTTLDANVKHGMASNVSGLLMASTVRVREAAEASKAVEQAAPTCAPQGSVQ